MMIQVRYTDGTFDKVHRQLLQDLIAQKRIRSFLRSSGWVDVECDPVRRKITSPTISCPYPRQPQFGR